MENETKNLDEYSMYINMLETGKRYMAMMNKYRCAIMEVETKLKVLNICNFSLILCQVSRAARAHITV